MINLGLKRKEMLFQDTESELLSEFYSKSTDKSNREFRFARVDSNFINFLPYLKDGAVKLYLYYAAAAKNETGASWHSVDTISQKLGATERSIGNWNRQLENLGLIFRSSRGKRSKTTFILPLTSFAVKMHAERMNQVFTELKLSEANEASRIFFLLQSITKLYIKSQGSEAITSILCVRLNRVFAAEDTVIHNIDTYIFTVLPPLDKDTDKKLSECEGKGNVVIVDEEKKVTLGRKVFESINSFLVRVPFRVDEALVYDIMNQLTKSDVDFSDVDHISMQDLGGKNE